MHHRILPPFYGESVDIDCERSKSVPVLATAGSEVRIGRLVGHGHPYCEAIMGTVQYSHTGILGHLYDSHCPSSTFIGPS
jgi:hypothetical protein